MKKRIASLLCAAAVTMSAVPSVYAADDSSYIKINEVCSSNSKTVKDSSGKYSDYIELHNTSKKEISLAGMGLSDNTEDKFLFMFPKGAVIPADGYVIVFCDDGKKSSKGEYHAGFKISSDGETVYLTSAGKKSIDKVIVPSMGDDMVFGRVKDGKTFGILTPTPAKSNASAKRVAYVSKPSFSAESGFYPDSFPLELTCGDGCTVKYTLDGTDPRKSKTAVTYSGAIDIHNNNSDKNVLSNNTDICLMNYTPPSSKVDKGMVIRAVSVNKSGKYSDVVTNTYFVKKNAPYYKSMKVVSLVTDSRNLFDSKTGIYAVGDIYDEWKRSKDYQKYEDVNVNNVTNYNQSGRDWERPASVEIFSNGKRVLAEDVGIRIVGNYSRSYAQKSFTFYARSEYGSSKMKYELFSGLTDRKGKTIDSFDKITIRNGGNECWGNMATRFRDTLVSELAKGLDISAAAEEDCVLFINGEFWGYYAMNEKLDESYIESHYGIDKDEVTTMKNWETDGDKKVMDDYISFYYWAVGADMKDEKNYKRFCDTIDVQSFMDYITVETYVCNNDWSNLDYVNNFMMWRSNKKTKGSRYADGKWRYMLFDADSSAGLYYAENTKYDFDALGKMNKEKTWGNMSAIFYKVMENKEFRTAFYDNYKKIVRENFAPERVDVLIGMYSSRINAVSTATDQRFGNSNNYTKAVEQVKKFYSKRPEYALKYLDELMEKYS